MFSLLRSPYFSWPCAVVSSLHAQIKKTRHDGWAYRVAIYGYRAVLQIIVLQGTYPFLMNMLGRIIHESIWIRVTLWMNRADLRIDACVKKCSIIDFLFTLTSMYDIMIRMLRKEGVQ